MRHGRWSKLRQERKTLAHGVSRGTRTCPREPLEGAKERSFAPSRGFAQGSAFPGLTPWASIYRPAGLHLACSFI